MDRRATLNIHTHTLAGGFVMGTYLVGQCTVFFSKRNSVGCMPMLLALVFPTWSAHVISWLVSQGHSHTHKIPRGAFAGVRPVYC